MNAVAPRRVCLQLGFGLGQTFLPAWQHGGTTRSAPGVWTSSPSRPARPRPQALHQAPELAAQWPPPTPNLHRLAFDGGRVHLLLAVGPPLDVLPELRAQVDAFLLDDFAPRPTRSVRRCGWPRAWHAWPRPGPGCAPPSALQALRPALHSAGFELEPDGSRTRAVYRPRFTPRRRGATARPDSERHALIVGAGLAGCATACALAEQGWRSTVIDRAEAPAMEGSGNPAGLFHGIVNPQDGAHARFNRAAALLAQRTVQQAIAGGAVRGSAHGLLRLDTRGAERRRPARRTVSAAAAAGLRAGAGRGAGQRSAAGLPLQHPAWFYPGGGWVQPAASGALVCCAGRRCSHASAAACRCSRCARPTARWQLLDATGSVIAEAATVVLANAFDALRLLQATALAGAAGARPDQPVRRPRSCTCRGCRWPAPATCCPPSTARRCSAPASQPGDDDAAVREADHRFNLQRLAQLSPQPAARAAIGCRAASAGAAMADDRLPLIGAVPEAARPRRAERLDQALPRRPGLFVFTALGSRGIAWVRPGRAGAGGTGQRGTVAAGGFVGGCAGSGALCAAGRAPRRPARLNRRVLSRPTARRLRRRPPSRRSCGAPSSPVPGPALRSAFSFSFSSFFFFLASSRWRFSNE